jgi:hypothetical protein
MIDRSVPCKPRPLGRAASLKSHGRISVQDYPVAEKRET